MRNEAHPVFYNIVAFIFPGYRQARSIHDDLKARQQYDAYGVVATSVVEVDDRGKAHFHPAGRSTRGAAIGILAGGILGLLGGPEGLLVWTVLGAIIGGQVGKRVDGPIPQDDLRQLAAQMRPDTSAILALLEKARAQALIEDMPGMAGYESRVVQLAVSDTE